MSAKIQSGAQTEATWGAWRVITPKLEMEAGALAETLSGGQAFRWRWHAEGSFWQGVWGEHIARVRVGDKNLVEWSAPVEQDGKTGAALADYLAADVDFAGLVDALPWRTDAVLKEMIQAWGGLRLLRQPLGETLLAFLCSSAKRIPHIAQMCEAMAGRLGRPVWEHVRGLPDWAQLAKVAEADLRACGLGYRARFVKLTAEKLAHHPQWEARIKRMPYAEAHDWLAALPGVGPKIADCVLLFGAAKYEAFPVDTWILQAMAARYGLEQWRPVQVAQFGRAHFGPLAGLAQQFLFSGERKGGESKRRPNGRKNVNAAQATD